MGLDKIIKDVSLDKEQDNEAKNTYEPNYVRTDDYLSSMRCACACNPGPPGPYCGPPKCSTKIKYE